MLSEKHGRGNHAKKSARGGKLSFLRVFMTAALTLSLVGGGVAFAEDGIAEGETADPAIEEPAAQAVEQPAENAAEPAAEEPADSDDESVDAEVPADQMQQPAASGEEELAVDDVVAQDVAVQSAAANGVELTAAAAT